MRNVKLIAINVVLLSILASTSMAQIDDSKTNQEIEVMLFIAPDCPISQKYVNKIKSLFIDYQSDIKINVYFPDQYNQSMITAFKEEYSIMFDIKRDLDNTIAKKMNVKVTPEVFLLKNSRIEYSGAIDNWFYALGKNRLKVTHNYLTDAITSIMKNEKSEILKTRAIGCFINY